MNMEDESWRKQFPDEKEGEDRDGNTPQNREGETGRSGRRPRIQRQPYVNNNEYRPRENRGYVPRDTYPRREGEYQPREGGYQRREGGYQPRGYQHREGGFQPREYQRRDDGYQRREGGYQPREGGYQPRGNYLRREGYRPQGSRPNYGQQDYGQQQRRPFRTRTANYDPNARYSQKKRIEYKELHYDPNEPIRLNRFLANAGVCSRRDADNFIQAGVVSVNGNVVTELGTKVLRSDEVRFHDQPVKMEKKVYVLLNKPKDYVTTSDDPQNRKTVMELVKDACSERIYPVGRLDRSTTGVLLLTNDGDLSTKLTHPQYKKKKIYHVFLDKNISAADMRKIADGIHLEDGEAHADSIEYAHETDRKQVGIEIHSGRNRIVRRIFEHLGYKVIKLDRVYFAGLTKKNVKRGDWRYLTEKEVAMLQMGAFE